MIAAWHQDRFHFGFPLGDKKGPDAVPPHKLITSFKLLIYDKHRDSAQVSRVNKQLEEAGKSFSLLVEHALSSIWAGIFSRQPSKS